MARPSTDLLHVPYFPQADDGYCLAACIQMVMAHLGLSATQERLARQLDVRPPLGAPASNVLAMRSDILDVELSAGDLDALQSHVADGAPPIAFIQTGELSYWDGYHCQHAVVVVGTDAQTVYVLDPAAGAAPISIPAGDFMLAWSELDYLYAVIRPRYSAGQL